MKIFVFGVVLTMLAAIAGAGVDDVPSGWPESFTVSTPTGFSEGPEVEVHWQPSSSIYAFSGGDASIEVDDGILFIWDTDGAQAGYVFDGFASGFPPPSLLQFFYDDAGIWTGDGSEVGFPIPEPAAGVLAALGSLMLCGRRGSRLRHSPCLPDSSAA